MDAAVHHGTAFEHASHAAFVFDDVALAVSCVFAVAVPDVDEAQGEEFADGALPDQFAHLERCGAEAVVEASEEHDVGFLGDFDHFLAFCHVHSQGLFAEDVLAVLGCVANVLDMAGSGGCDGNCVDAAIEEGLLVREAVGDLVLVLNVGETFWIGFEDGSQGQARRVKQNWDVPVVGDCSTAHESDFLHRMNLHDYG